MLLGACAGDVAGSRFEWNNTKSTDFELFAQGCRVTDDTVMTAAVNAALRAHFRGSEALDKALVSSMRRFGAAYPLAGYGLRFSKWLRSDDPRPYNSLGNGSAMRASPAGWWASSANEALELGKATAEVTHNHPDGIRGAQAVAGAVWLARAGADKARLRRFIESDYYSLDFALDEIRPVYKYDVTCAGSIPQAFEAFFESDSFEEALRLAISIGGDSDTIAAVAGSVAEAFYGLPAAVAAALDAYLDPTLRAALAAPDED